MKPEDKLTGKEWYDRFNHELKSFISDLDIPQYETALEAARLASGLPESFSVKGKIKRYVLGENGLEDE